MNRETTLDLFVVRPRGTASAWRATRRAVAELAATTAPIAAVGVLNLGISITDMLMMAHLDRRALATGALVSDVYSIAFQFATGVVSAVTPHVARAHAAGDPRRVREVVGRCLGLAVALAALGGVVVWHAPALLGALGVELSLPIAGGGYARYMSVTFGLMLMVVIGRCVLPALGKGVVPMAVMAAAVPLNAVGDAILMYGWLGAPRMGLAGAGAASLLVGTACTAALWLHATLAPSMRAVTFARRLAPAPRVATAGLLREGLLTGAASLCETGVFLSSTMLVAMLDARSVPAHVVVFRCLALTYAVNLAFGQAVTIHVARADVHGKERSSAVHHAAVGAALALAASFALALCAVPWLPLGGLTAGDTTRIAELAPWAAIAASGLVPAVVAFAALRARFDVAAPTALGLVGYWILGFPCMLLLGGLRGHGALGVWAGLALGAVATAALRSLYLVRTRASATRAVA